MFERALAHPNRSSVRVLGGVKGVGERYLCLGLQARSLVLVQFLIPLCSCLCSGRESIVGKEGRTSRDCFVRVVSTIVYSPHRLCLPHRLQEIGGGSGFCGLLGRVDKIRPG